MRYRFASRTTKARICNPTMVSSIIPASLDASAWMFSSMDWPLFFGNVYLHALSANSFIGLYLKDIGNWTAYILPEQKCYIKQTFYEPSAARKCTFKRRATLSNQYIQRRLILENVFSCIPLFESALTKRKLSGGSWE